MNEKSTPRLALIASMVLFGSIGVFRRYIPLPSSFIAMTRGFVGALVLLLILFLRRRRPNGPAIRRHLLLLLVSGAAIGVNWILLFEAYNYTTVATATLCYYFAPSIVVLLSPLVLRERLTGKKILCVLLALAGMTLVSGVVPGGFGGAGELRGVLLGLGAAMFYASVVLMNQRIAGVEAFDRTLVQLFAAAVVILPYVLLSGDAQNLAFTPVSAVLLAIVCVVHTGLAYAMFFSSFSKLPTPTIALLSYIDPVVALLLSALFLREELTVLTAIGAVLILGAALWCELPPRTKKEK